MPAVSKTGGGSWGITWQEVRDLVVDYEGFYSCKLECIVTLSQYGQSGSGRHWLVATRATSGRAGASRHEGYAECSVGGASGAASFPGAFVRSIVDACQDLERRRWDKRHDRDNPVPPRT